MGPRNVEAASKGPGGTWTEQRTDRSYERKVKERLYALDETQRAALTRRLTSAVAEDGDLIFAYLFGSFVAPLPFHDIDVGVYLRDGGDGSRALALGRTLSERVAMPVDVRVLNTAPVSFLYHVLRGSRLFCRDDSVLAEVMERTIAGYLDAEPLLRQATREAFAR